MTEAMEQITKPRKTDESKLNILTQLLNQLVTTACGILIPRILIAADHLKQTHWGAYSEALINIILSCILIKWEPLLGVAIGTLVATVFRAIYYMAYSAKDILRLPIHKILLTFFVTILLLFAVTLRGVLMIRTVVIKNFISWTLCGGLCFLIIAPPAAFAARKICSK